MLSAERKTTEDDDDDEANRAKRQPTCGRQRGNNVGKQEKNPRGARNGQREKKKTHRQTRIRNLRRETKKEEGQKKRWVERGGGGAKKKGGFEINPFSEAKGKRTKKRLRAHGGRSGENKKEA